MAIPASPSSVSKCRRHRRTIAEPCRCFPPHYRLSLSTSCGHATPSLWPGWEPKSGVSIAFIGGRSHLTANTPQQIVASTQNPVLQMRESSVSISRSWTHVGRSQQRWSVNWNQGCYMCLTFILWDAGDFQLSTTARRWEQEVNVEWTSQNLALSGEGLNGETLRHRKPL